MSYEEEKEALWEWYMQKIREYIEVSKQEYQKGYLDSEADVLYRENNKEFNRRLAALREKYGVK
jgi:hypothetical protein